MRRGWLNPTQSAVGWTSIAAGATEGMAGTGTTLKSIGAIGGISLMLSGTIIDAIGVLKYYKDPYSPNAVSPQNATINTGISAFSFLTAGSGGEVVAPIYFIIDNTIGWPTAVRGSKAAYRVKLYQIQHHVLNYSDYKF